MRNVVKKMLYEMPYGLFRFQVLLTANMTISANYLSATVQTVLFLPFL